MFQKLSPFSILTERYNPLNVKGRNRQSPTPTVKEQYQRQEEEIEHGVEVEIEGIVIDHNMNVDNPKSQFHKTKSYNSAYNIQKSSSDINPSLSKVEKFKVNIKGSIIDASSDNNQGSKKNHPKIGNKKNSRMDCVGFCFNDYLESTQCFTKESFPEVVLRATTSSSTSSTDDTSSSNHSTPTSSPSKLVLPTKSNDTCSTSSMTTSSVISSSRSSRSRKNSSRNKSSKTEKSSKDGKTKKGIQEIDKVQSNYMNHDHNTIDNDDYHLHGLAIDELKPPNVNRKNALPSTIISPTTPLSSSDCSSVLAPPSITTNYYNRSTAMKKNNHCNSNNSNLHFSLPSAFDNSTNVDRRHQIHNKNNNSNDADDDCTVIISNMTSTQTNKLSHFQTSSSSLLSTSLTSSSFSPKILIHNNTIESIIQPTNHVLDELRKEWDLTEEEDKNCSGVISSGTSQNSKKKDLPLVFPLSSSSSFPTLSKTKKKKKNVIQKTSKKVKKIFNLKQPSQNDDLPSNDDDSFHTDEAGIVPIPPEVFSQYHQAKNNDLPKSKSDRFTDLWLKKSTDAEEILVKHSQENILMGTPLQIGTRQTNGSGTNNGVLGSGNATKENSPLKLKNSPLRVKNSPLRIKNSPLRVKKSNSFSFGSTLKMRRTGSDLISRASGSSSNSGSSISGNIAPSRIFQRKQHKRALSNQSDAYLSSIGNGSTNHKGSFSPQRLNRCYNRAASSITKDDAIKGRLDGIDVLSLGPVRCISYIGSKQKSLAGQRYTLRSMVSDTLAASSGRDSPEVVLEGFSATGKDRWTVSIEDYTTSKFQNQRNAKLTNTEHNHGHKSKDEPELYKDSEIDYEESAIKSMPTHLLLTQIWGEEGPPPPTHSINFEVTDTKDESESGFRAVSSCPIDLEKDVFVFKEDDHLQSAHSIAVVPLKYGRFDESITVFEKVLSSLKHKYAQRDHFLIGACYHNLGVLEMWAGRYEEALTYFDEAIAMRMRTMTSYHPSVAVSQSKIGMVYFALEQLDKALEAFENALEIRMKYQKVGNLEIAKLCNNIAAVHYQKGDKKLALKKFEEAFEIMKILVEGPVRRESLVYDISIILSNMGKIYLERNKYEMAYRMLEDALMFQTSTFKKNHDCILRSLSNIAFAKDNEGETTKALQIYKSLIKMQTEKFGPMSSQAIETKGLMSVLYIKLGKYKEANRCLKGVSKWQQINLDKHHPALTNTKNTIKKLKQAIKGGRESFADL